MAWTSRDQLSSVRLEPWGLVVREPDGSEQHIVGPTVDDVELCPTELRIRCGDLVYEIGGFTHDNLGQIEAALLAGEWEAPPPGIAAEEALIEERQRSRHLPRAVAALLVAIVAVALTIVGFGLARRPGTPPAESTSTEASTAATPEECRDLLAQWSAATGGDAGSARDRFLDRECDRVCEPVPGAAQGAPAAWHCAAAEVKGSAD